MNRVNCTIRRAEYFKIKHKTQKRLSHDVRVFFIAVLFY